eukprot:1551110-Pyramimonas_sp.AAC.1
MEVRRSDGARLSKTYGGASIRRCSAEQNVRRRVDPTVRGAASLFCWLGPPQGGGADPSGRGIFPATLRKASSSTFRDLAGRDAPIKLESTPLIYY